MLCKHFHSLVRVSFGCALLSATACGSDAPQTAPMAAAGQGNMSGANTAGSLGVSGSATAGGTSGTGEASAPGSAGAAAVTGTAGADSRAGSAGNSASAGGRPSSGGAGSSGSPCHARSGLLACDDFEGATRGTVPMGPWSAVVIGEGSVTVDDSVVAHSGSKTVHVHGAGYQTFLVYHDATRLPQASGRFYLRAFVRLAEAMTAGHNTFVLADTFAAPNTGNALRLGEQNGMLMLTVGGDAHGYLSNQSYYNDHLPGIAFKPAEYSCLELLLDSMHAEIQVWVDGADVPDLHVTGLAHENYDALRFGFEKYAGPESDIWYDDIALGTERIGCD